ncbi:MAG: hypothetical protein V8R80_01455, partial [Eubacterium sp.]
IFKCSLCNGFFLGRLMELCLVLILLKIYTKVCDGSAVNAGNQTGRGQILQIISNGSLRYVKGIT